MTIKDNDLEVSKRECIAALDRMPNISAQIEKWVNKELGEVTATIFKHSLEYKDYDMLKRFFKNLDKHPSITRNLKSVLKVKPSIKSTCFWILALPIKVKGKADLTEFTISKSFSSFRIFSISSVATLNL